jgi:transcription elongation GreA/GreB family factor
VGRAVMGHKKGEEVEVSTPGGATTMKIVSIKAP